MKSHKDRVAEEIAIAHYLYEPAVSRIYRLIAANEANNEEPIKLLELNRDTVSIGIEPIYFGQNETDYPLVLVVISPEEYSQQIIEELQNKYGWELGDAYDRPETLEPLPA
jgi:hypothetical protein